MDASTSFAPVDGVHTLVPTISDDTCIPQNVTGFPFTDITLSFAVTTFDRTTAFLDALSQGLLASVVEESSFLCVAQHSALGRRLRAEELGGVMSVEVADISISDTETCVAVIDESVCHVVDVTLRVYGETPEDSQSGAIAVGAVVRSKLQQKGGLIMGDDFFPTREYQSDKLEIDTADDGRVESSRRMKSGSIVGTVIGVGGFVCLSVAVVLLVHKRVSSNNDKSFDTVEEASKEKSDQSLSTMEHATVLTP
jgi:hypothetical protein